MLAKFQTYQLSIQFYRQCHELAAPGFLKNQLLRAASSVALNLSEGSTKSSIRERKRFYAIALSSLRECQTALELNQTRTPALIDLADHLGACLYRLVNPRIA